MKIGQRINLPTKPATAASVIGSRQVATGDVTQQQPSSPAVETTSRRTDQTPFNGGGLPAPLLNKQLATGLAELHALETIDLPTTPQQLVDDYARLGRAIATADACLLSALDALDARTGGGTARPAKPYTEIREQAFAALRESGHLFDRFEKSFSSIVHGDKAWPNQPVVVNPDRGDGKPRTLYLDTFKKSPGLTAEQRQQEYQSRVDKFLAKGGRFEDIIVGRPGVFETLESGVHYDYVIAGDGTLRLGLLEDQPGKPKPGHSLLARGSARFNDDPVIAAGELWVVKDTAGDVEAIVVANNSGHFKPSFDDMGNSVPALEQLGAASDKIVLFGGPNNLPSMFEEIKAKYPEVDVENKLPPASSALLASFGETFDPLAIRLPR